MIDITWSISSVEVDANDIVLSWLSKDKAEQAVQEALNVEPTQLREVTL